MVGEKMVSTKFGGLQDMESGHLALEMPQQEHLALGMPGLCAGQTLAPPGA